MGTISHDSASLPARPLRIGELARATGKSARALHLYEELGIIQPVERTRGGFRLYAPESIERVQWIDKLHALGLTLAQISAFVRELATLADGPRAMAHVRAIFEEKLVEVRTALERLHALESELEQSLTYLRACDDCPRPATRCATCDLPHACTERPPLVGGLHADARPWRVDVDPLRA